MHRMRAGLGVLFAVVLLGSTASAAGGPKGAGMAGTSAARPVAVQVTRVPPPLPSPPPAPTVLRNPATVTFADNGTLVLLSRGASFTLQLGGQGDWQVTVSDPAVLAGPSGVALPATATYTAKTPGTSRLRAEMVPACVKATPACLPPVMLFQVTVTVGGGAATGAPLALIAGQVVAVTATGVRLGFASGSPECSGGGPTCATACGPERFVSVALSGTSFDGPVGSPVPRPSLAIGETLTAAGTWAATDVFRAQVAMVTAPPGTRGHASCPSGLG